MSDWRAVVPAVVLFHAGYCRACKAVVPKFERLAAEYGGRALFCCVKMEDALALATRVGIRQVPCVHVYDGENGKVEDFPCGPSSVARLRDTVRDIVAESERRGGEDVLVTAR